MILSSLTTFILAFSIFNGNVLPVRLFPEKKSTEKQAINSTSTTSTSDEDDESIQPINRYQIPPAKRAYYTKKAKYWRDKVSWDGYRGKYTFSMQIDDTNYDIGSPNDLSRLPRVYVKNYIKDRNNHLLTAGYYKLYVTDDKKYIVFFKNSASYQPRRLGYTISVENGRTYYDEKESGYEIIMGVFDVKEYRTHPKKFYRSRLKVKFVKIDNDISTMIINQKNREFVSEVKVFSRFGVTRKNAK